MNEFPTTRTNKEVIFNTILRTLRRPIECAYGRLKARWKILNKLIYLGLDFLSNTIYMLALFCIVFVRGIHGLAVEDDVSQIHYDYVK